MENRVFARLTVIKLSHKDKSYNKYWECRCACGQTTTVRTDKLVSGKIKSCGCLATERLIELQVKATEENRKYTKRSYMSMRDRCTNPNSPAYAFYGAKGITLCNRWLNGENNLNGWTCFFMDMGPRPQGMSIDRIDNAIGYTPENCRWADKYTQARNRSTTKLNTAAVQTILAGVGTKREMANQYGVSIGQVKKIRQRKAWKQI